MPFRKYKPKTNGSKYAKKKAYNGKRKYTNRRASTKAKYIRKVSRSIKTYAETKKKMGDVQVDVVPTSTWTYGGPGPALSSNVFTVGYDFSVNPGGAADYGTSLSTTLIRQGTDADERIGNYIVSKAISGSFRISMNTIETSATPWEVQPIHFKVIWFLAKRQNTPTGTFFNPSEYLFLKPDGTAVGPASEDTGAQSMTLLNFFTAPVNAKHFKVLKTKSFTLGPPAVYGDAGHHLANTQSNSNLPSHKIVNFRMSVQQKVKYGGVNVPTDRNMNYRMMVLAMPTGGAAYYPCNHWKFSMNSVMNYTDL